jgi:hypothetical protein
MEISRGIRSICPGRFMVDPLPQDSPGLIFSSSFIRCLIPGGTPSSTLWGFHAIRGYLEPDRTEREDCSEVVPCWSQ